MEYNRDYKQIHISQLLFDKGINAKQQEKHFFNNNITNDNWTVDCKKQMVQTFYSSQTFKFS